MKLVFYHRSERVYKDNKGNLYTSGNFTPEVWERYLSIADELSVVMTDSGKIISEEEGIKTKQKVDTEKINMILLPEKYSSVKSFFSPDRASIERKAVDDCDFAIIRSASSPLIDYCRKKGIPYAVEVVGCLWDAYWNHSLKGKIMAPYQFLSAKRRVKKAPYVLYVTNEFLQRRYPTNGKTTNCSNVSLGAFDDNVLEERLRKIENHTGTMVLGTAAAGLDIRFKGQQFVIRALSQLKKKGITNFRYDIVGAGDPSYLLGEAQKHGVSDQVNIVGQLTHDGLMDWLKGIDLYIQPSLQEGLPRSVIEAMSVGLPCAGSSVAGIPELLDGSMLFKGKDVKGIANILENISKEQMLTLSKENFEKAKTYDVNIISKRRLEFYKDFRKYAENKKGCN